MVKDGFADPEVLGRYFQKLVIRKKLETLLQAELSGRNEPQCLIAAGGSGVGQVLRAAYIDGHIVQDK